jgi:hypothetical protein
VLAIVKRILWNISSHIAGGEISGEIEGVSDFENMGKEIEKRKSLILSRLFSWY